jgi:integrase
MTSRALNVLSVKNFKPGKARVEVGDAGCPGLYLVVQPSGRKSWALRTRKLSDGRTAKLTLGTVNLYGNAQEEPKFGAPLSLGQARQLAESIKYQRHSGVDVVDKYKDESRRRQAEHAAKNLATYPSCARDFVVQYATGKTKRRRNTARVLGFDPNKDLEAFKGGLADRWKDRPIGSINRDAIHDLIDEVRINGIPGREARKDGPKDAQAKVALAILSKCFAWLVEKRRAPANPCQNVPRPKSGGSRERTLTDDEIRAYWNASEWEFLFGPVLKILLYTGVRLNEAAGMRRSELNADMTLWALPGSRTKNGKAHDVPLAPAVREIIRKVGTTGDLVFTTTGVMPLSGWSALKRRLDKAMGLTTPWVLHDIRRTFVTGLNDIGVLPHVAEACVNHISGAAKGGVAGVYNKSVYSKEKKVALERWAVHVDGLVSGNAPNVTSIRSAP